MVNFDAAQAYCLAIKDQVTRELVGLCFSRLVTRFVRGEGPDENFDAMYFVKTVEAAMTQHDSLRHVLAGGTLLWPEIE